MIGMFYHGDAIVAIETWDAMNWKVNVLMLWVNRNSGKPMVFAILH